MDQPLLLPETLDEALEPNHPVRGIKAIIDQIPDSILVNLYAPHGGVPYAPKSLLGVWLYAFMEGEYSTRKLEAHCRYDLRYRFLCQAQRPDDRTLGRFFLRMKPAMAELMALVLDLAQKQGLLSLRVIALDGTRVPGNVSQLSRAIDKVECADPDARRIRGPKGFLNGYNAQAAVDVDSRMVAGSSVSSCSSDASQLPVVLSEVQRLTGKPPDSLVADAGYDSSVNLSYMESEGVVAYVATKDDKIKGWSVDDQSRPVCPAGHTSTFRDQYVRTDGKMTRRWVVRECADCPLKQACGAVDHRFVSAPVGIDFGLRTRNDSRCRSPEGQAMMTMRRTTVEPFFGHLKWNLGMRRFHRRGLSNVQAEFLLSCLTWNVRILMNRTFWRAYRQLIEFQLTKLGAILKARVIRDGLRTNACHVMRVTQVCQ